MAQVSTSDFKPGVKVEVDNQPWIIVSAEFVKPGKGQAFTRTRLKNLITGRVIDRTYKSGEKLDLADIVETRMRLLYREADGAVFMDDESFEQVSVPWDLLEEVTRWLKDDLVYDVILYKGQLISVVPPTFLELKIVETEPGAKGDTAAGRVLKSAVTETGAKVQIPLFIEQGEMVRFDTRSGEYVSRVSKG